MPVDTQDALLQFSGEDYLFPEDYFVPVELLQAVLEAFSEAA